MEYISRIAKVNKEERFKSIISILQENDISYRIQQLNYPRALGNIIVEFNRSNSNKLVIGAHYDNYPGTPGANDNAAACSILLNLIIKNTNTTKHLEFVFFDLEEEFGQNGSREYINFNIENIDKAINLDMCGLGENILISKPDTSDIDSVISKYNARVYDYLPPSDADNFNKRGIETYFVVNSTTRDLKWYDDFIKYGMAGFDCDFLKTMHKPNDTIDTINLDQVEIICNFVNELIENLQIK